MTFNFGAWLHTMMEQKSPDGGRLYAPEALQDFLALLLLSSDKPLNPLPVDVAKILAAFLERTGLDQVKEPAALQQALTEYFAAHPLPPSLVQSFQHEFQRDPGGKRVAPRSIRP